jgi:hypothetical protein
MMKVSNNIKRFGKTNLDRRRHPGQDFLRPASYGKKGTGERAPIISAVCALVREK